MTAHSAGRLAASCGRVKHAREPRRGALAALDVAQRPRLGECTDIMAPQNAATGRTLRYKFVELSLVTDESLERAVNEWVAQGWALDRIHFVTSDASRRPVMAFVGFVREVDGTDGPVDAETEPGPDAVSDDAELDDRG